MPDVRTLRLVRVADDLWIDPHEVVALREEFFPGSMTWLTRIYLRRGTAGSPFTVKRRVAEILAALEGDQR